jgi:hypothetical protein
MDTKDAKTLQSLSRDVVKEVVACKMSINAAMRSRELMPPQSSSSSSSKLVSYDPLSQGSGRAANQPPAIDSEDVTFVRYCRALLHRAVDVVENLKDVMPIEFYFDTLTSLLEPEGEHVMLVKHAMELIKARLQVGIEFLSS